MLGLARELRLRGHDVLFFASDNFRASVEAEHVEFVAVGTATDYAEVISDPRLWHPTHGLQVLFDAVMRFTPPAYELLLRHYRHGETVLAASSTSFAARLVQETQDAPSVTVHLAPSVFRSALDSIHLSGMSIREGTPAWVKRSFWWLVDRFAIDPLIVPKMNEFRASLGLAPIHRILDRWLHSPDRVIGMFPDWFAACRPDWPTATRLTGFPLYDAAAHEPLPDGLESFLHSGSAPVLFAPGTANVSATEFFETSLAACEMAGRRALFVTRHAEQIPTQLPDWAAHFPYLPFSAVLPRCSAFVNHGGIGSLSQGFRTGIPQLVRPMAFDQFDNARRAERLGVARVLAPAHYKSRQVATALEDIAASAYTNTCRDIAQRSAHNTALADAAAYVEEVLN
jgi:UDP:flavonoid glycosyltransferase YjiC (YdhE family)